MGVPSPACSQRRQVSHSVSAILEEVKKACVVLYLLSTLVDLLHEAPPFKVRACQSFGSLFPAVVVEMC